MGAAPHKGKVSNISQFRPWLRTGERSRPPNAERRRYMACGSFSLLVGVGLGIVHAMRRLPEPYTASCPTHLVSRQAQPQQATQQQSDHTCSKQHPRPGVLLSLRHRVVRLCRRSMPEAGEAREAHPRQRASRPVRRRRSRPPSSSPTRSAISSTANQTSFWRSVMEGAAFRGGGGQPRGLPASAATAPAHQQAQRAHLYEDGFVKGTVVLGSRVVPLLCGRARFQRLYRIIDKVH